MNWEYIAIKVEVSGFWGDKLKEPQLEGILNEYGRQGWELVSASSVAQMYGATKYLLTIFKRPRR